MVERAVKRVDGFGPKGVAQLGAVEGDADDGEVGACGDGAVGPPGAFDSAVIGDVLQIESDDVAPALGVEGLGDCRRKRREFVHG